MYAHIPDIKDNRADAWLEGWYASLGTTEAQANEQCYVDDTESLSRAQVEDISGRMYAYFKANGIGRETFIMLNLTRGARVFVAMLGVLKAGAAFVVAEAGYPAERVAFIAKDLDCKLIIDDAALETILKTPYERGFEHAENNDAAYAVYTSGTTGTPKGIIHERGSMLMSHKSVLLEDGYIPKTSDRFAVLAPLNFSATMLIFNAVANMGGVLYIPAYDTLKNPGNLLESFAKHDIHGTFMAPSMLARFANLLPECIKLVIVGAESADGVHGGENRDTWNLYMSSETCFVMAAYKIIEPTTPCPIGKPLGDIETWLTDDGQLVTRAPYCRGYVHASSDDAENPFVSGCYYTGDIAEEDQNSNFILRGRMSEMVKINGNRVEPEEVEKAFTRITGLACIAKGFENREDAFVALYYIPAKNGKDVLDTQNCIEAMKKLLPYYMIPSYFVPIPTLPVNELGKLDRKQLVKPSAEHKPYIAPVTDVQRILCDATAKVLKLDRVGLADDFFELGGRSLDAIAVLEEAKLEGLTATMFYHGRTIAGIAETYGSFLSQFGERVLSQEEKELEARKQIWPLKDSAKWLAFLQITAPETTEFANLYSTFRLSKLINLEKLCAAINEYTAKSSTFQTIIALNEEHMPCYKFAPELYKPIEVETMTEEEVDELRKTFVQPHRILEEYPWRIRLIKTKKHNYLFWDMHHTLTDGAGVSLIAQDIFNYYLGKPTMYNDLYAYMYDNEQLSNSVMYKQAVEYQQRVFDTHDVFGERAFYEETNEVGFRETERSCGIKIKHLNEFLLKHKCSRGDLFAAAYALAYIREYKKFDVRVGELFARRTGEKNIAGVRAIAINLGFNCQDVKTIEDLLDVVSRDMRRAISMSSYNYEQEAKNPTHFPAIDDLEDMEEIPPLLTKFVERLDEPETCFGDNEEPIEMSFLINFINKKDELYIRGRIDRHFLSDERRERAIDWMVEALQRIIAGDETVIADFFPKAE